MLRFRKKDAAGQPWVSITWAILALALFLFWQFLTVHYNRGGNWTALFLTGSQTAIPPDLAPETYQFRGRGFDGEMYRYVAHDLFMRRGYLKYVDGPAQRYHRILIPALAYLLVAGHQPWIDGSYIAVVALFALLGAYWLSRWAVLSGHHPAWALAFLLAPATLISMDRLTIDIALAAFTVALAFYWRTSAWPSVFVVLMLACLARETGALLVGGCCLAELFNRRLIRAVTWGASALPALAWYLFIRRALPEKTHFGVPTWVAGHAQAGIFRDLRQPPHYPLPPLLEMIARWGDVLSLLAILAAAVLAILFLRANPRSPLAMAAVLFTALVFLLTIPSYWNDVNGYARVFSPLLILVALGSLARESGVPWWAGLIPALLVDLRLSMEFAAPAGGIVRGLLR
ncbi:MAG TPA: hypothetical protein VME17_02060 [Bryobacteraceae bacterium]|nr:hypothetical protein [Bryobacteraceae bacterium]